MPRSEVLAQILSDYLSANPGQSRDVLDAFCEYAGQWFCTHNIVGLGTTAEGMALRFGDGRVMTFFVAQDMPHAAVTPPVTVIGGNAGSEVGNLVNAAKNQDGSVNITR